MERTELANAHRGVTEAGCSAKPVQVFVGAAVARQRREQLGGLWPDAEHRRGDRREHEDHGDPPRDIARSRANAAMRDQDASRRVRDHDRPEHDQQDGAVEHRRAERDEGG